ncbi:hypothetical protein M2282_003483 [Variovorax boronicumulans]|uniref:hypothetical protein n=1 Tax=Variovorax boronicumulans TaxID=436515 RepID=UPI0024763689|nr:hypothetical protein [Variovorax boronicumulans]MDH6168332.1 hypothetical protein [Variovorax boronicumulans]
MAAALSSRTAPSGSGSERGSERYWAPCLAVALVAMSLFYVTLKDLVQESAARTPAPPPAVMPAYVEPTRTAEQRTVPAVPAPQAVQLTNASFEAPVTLPSEKPAKAVPAVTEVHKCVMPEGDAIYSDGPCPEGARASTLRLPRDLHASANQ